MIAIALQRGVMVLLLSLNIVCNYWVSIVILARFFFVVVLHLKVGNVVARRCTLCILVGRKVVWKEHGRKPSKVLGVQKKIFFFFSLFLLYYNFFVLSIWLIAT